MIKIKNLTVKNFMSVGNQTQAVDFDTQQITLVLGENLDQGGDDSGSRNGTGKTTIINALSYALYGLALTNIKRNNLINKTNSKGMLVTLSFEKDGREYKIERGRSPNILKFYVDGQEQEMLDESQGDSRKTQEDIQDLLGMSHNMFKHILALNTYTEPFLSMRVNDQKDIIEQLLGITILSEKAETLKEQIRKTKENITEENAKLTAQQSSNEHIGSTIRSLELKESAWKEKQSQDIEKLRKGIDELEHLDIDSELDSHEKLSNWTEHNNAIMALKKELSTLEPALVRADKSVNKVNKDIAELEDAVCYTCGQELHADKKAEIAERKSKELTDAKSYQEEINGKVKDVMASLDSIGDINGKPTTFYETAKEAYDHRSNVENLQKALISKQEENDPYAEQIKDLKETAIQEIDWATINTYTDLKDHQEFLLKLLTNKDSFIRKKIIDQNLAYLNNRLTTYLDKLGLPHQVVFKNDLAVEITQLGQDLDFDNLSRGERNRLILGMSFAFRDVWESLYQNINLLFIDELIDNGLDTAGVENALTVLKKMGRERQKNVYLISHKDELVGRVTHVLKVIKENGFTSYENDVEIHNE
jgi:DNA repair exonuclease SbcCD ATPase subunit|tara:strand:+ start:1284 stop:3059 length:1776 start_codon:yes stop_codon:yes gene_type:complete